MATKKDTGSTTGLTAEKPARKTTRSKKTASSDALTALLNQDQETAASAQSTAPVEDTAAPAEEEAPKRAKKTAASKSTATKKTATKTTRTRKAAAQDEADTDGADGPATTKKSTRATKATKKVQDEADIPSMSLTDELSDPDSLSTSGSGLTSFIAQLKEESELKNNRTLRGKTASTATASTSKTAKATKTTTRKKAAADEVAEEAAEPKKTTVRRAKKAVATPAETPVEAPAEPQVPEITDQVDEAAVALHEESPVQPVDAEPAPEPVEAVQPAEEAIIEPAEEPAAAEEAAPVATAEDPESPEFTAMVDRICQNIGLQEARAGMEDDFSSFEALMQYGDGNVECCVIGASDAPSRFVPAEPGHEHSFFRSCRRVQVVGVQDTPLPEEGFWIPPHPAPRSAAAYAHGLSNAREPRRSHAVPETPQPEVQAQAPAQTEDFAPRPTLSDHPSVLMCWVGKVDISAALRHDTVNPGPIRMLLEHVPPFDHILLLTSAGQNVQETLRTWLEPCISQDRLEVCKTEATDLSDHTTISAASIEAVQDIITRFGLPEDGSGLTFHLSPGSPVTHAVLLLLASIRYKGIRLMQTKLTGLGRDPDVLTVTLPQALTPDTPMALDLSLLADANANQADEDQDAGKSRRKPVLSPRGKGKPKGRELLERFRTGRKVQPAPAAAPAPVVHAAPAPVPTTIIQQAVPMATNPLDEFDLPVAVQEDSGLRAPQGNIGKPSKVSSTALQPKEGDPPTISSALGTIYKKMQRVAGMLLPILLLGESGSGKSRLARYLHEWSGRGGKFISLDCAGLTDELFYVELFGRAAVGGFKPREGAFRKARSGTLFLENVHLLTQSQQSMLVRVLAQVGETKLTLPAAAPYPSCSVKVRIIASATPELLTLIREGKFRTDLYYRLAGVSTMLPAVRDYTYVERENLLRSFLVSLQQKLGQCWNFSGDAWQALLDEEWPGNLREVARILQQICLLSDADTTITKEEVLQQLNQGRLTSTGGYTTLQKPSAINPAAIKPDFAPLFVDKARPNRDLDEDDDYEDEDADEPLSEDGMAILNRLGKKAPSGEGEDFFTLGSGANLDDTLSNMRLAKIVEAMNTAKGNRAEAARLLGLSYMQLNYTLKHLEEYRQESDK